MKNTESKKKVRLTISSDGVQSICCNASVFEKNGAVYIVYEHDGEPCSVKIKEKHATILRHKSGTRMEIEEGASHTSRYITPLGVLPFDITARRVDNRLDTDGTLTLEYLISAGGEADENKVIIKTEEIQNGSQEPA